MEDIDRKGLFVPTGLIKVGLSFSSTDDVAKRVVNIFVVKRRPPPEDPSLDMPLGGPAVGHLVQDPGEDPLLVGHTTRVKEMADIHARRKSKAKESAMDTARQHNFIYEVAFNPSSAAQKGLPAAKPRPRLCGQPDQIAHTHEGAADPIFRIRSNKVVTTWRASLCRRIWLSVRLVSRMLQF